MLRKLATLPSDQRKLLGIGLCWVLVVRTLLRFSARSLPEQQRWLDAVAARFGPLRGCTASRAAWAITAAARRIPGTRCLAWSVALRGLLVQSGLSAELRIGVARSELHRFKAHAWVEAAERSWTFGDDIDDYAILRPRPVAG
jgi:hypothetical protein